METQEAVYGIPIDKVMHIHGKRGEGDYLFGHNVYLSESDVFDDKDLIYETEAKDHIVHAMNELYKGCEGCNMS